MTVPAWAVIVAAVVTAGPAYIAAWNSVHNRRQLRVPSGGTLGAKVELTHDLAAVNAAGIATIVQPAMDRSIEHINGDPASPIKVNGDPSGTNQPQEET